MKKINPSLPKGTRDFGPDEMKKRNYVFNIFKKTFSLFGFNSIETPSLENIEILNGKYGDEGDKLIFRILNSGEFLKKVDNINNVSSSELKNLISSKGLRYDLTVPLARFVSSNRENITLPFKRYQIQNVWRADRPQKGRFREFYQCDADVIGSKSLLNEIELIQLCDDIFTSLNIPNIQILINNRKILAAMIELMSASEYFDQFVIILDKIDKIGVENVKKELIKLGLDIKKINLLDKFLNIKNINDISILVNQNELGKKGIEELDFILKSIGSLELKSSELKFNISLARGLDYYTGSIFEVKSSDVKIGSIAGGGRYDDLTSIFGLKDVSGVGISFGIDRIYLVMEELGLFPKDIDISSKVLFLNFGELEAKYCFKYLKELRNNNISSELYPNNDKIKKQMNYANNKGVQFVVMIGEDEMKSGQLTVKNMSTGEQNEMSISELIKIIL